MSDLGTIFGGLTGKSKADFSGGSARFVSYTNVFSNPATDLGRDDFVRVGPDERQRRLRQGDILLTGSSESLAEVAMSSVIVEPVLEPLYLNSFCVGVRPHAAITLAPDFAKHLFRSRALRSQLVHTASGVTRFNVSKARLGRVRVPLPPIEEQNYLAKALDAFHRLISGLSVVDLPAELAARRRQYEYYRDKLLTFEEKQ